MNQRKLIQSRFKSRLFRLHVFFAFFVFLRVLWQFRVRKIFRTIFFLRDFEPFHFLFEITISKMRNLWPPKILKFSK